MDLPFGHDSYHLLPPFDGYMKRIVNSVYEDERNSEMEGQSDSSTAARVTT